MTNAAESRTKLGWLLLVTAFIIALDRATKLWIVHNIPLGGERTIIPGVFHLSHALNEGAAFSLFADSRYTHLVRWSLIGFSLFVTIFVVAFLLRLGRRVTLTTVALSLILGGALGNTWDRIATGSVVDFLAVRIGFLHYDWPDFNVADSSIVTGACLLLFDALISNARQENNREADQA